MWGGRGIVAVVGFPMIVIGLDLGSVTGWAVGDASRLIGSGTWDLKGGRFEGGGMRYLRFRKLLGETIDVAAQDGPVAVFFEEVRRHIGTDAAQTYGGFMAALTSLCEERGIPYAGIPIGTIKKRATKKGNASKEDMISAANLQWRIYTQDDNRADALWVMQCGIEQMEGV